MGELAVIHSAPPQPAFSMGDIERVALAIAKGGLFGSNDPNAVLTLCLLAQAEGQHPAVVFRDYHIIQGRPAKKAEAMLRDFISAGGRIEWHGLTDELADATFSHPAGGSIRIDWTLKRAQQAGINTPMWKKYPRQMLRSRVISEGVRSVCPSATSGLYEVDEVRDIAADSPPAPSQNDDLQRAIDAPQGKGKHPGYNGPIKTKTALWAAVKAFDRELRSCGDIDQLEAFVAMPESQELLAQCDAEEPALSITGDGMPDEFVPLRTLISKMQSDLDAAAQPNEYVRENGMTIIDA